MPVLGAANNRGVRGLDYAVGQAKALQARATAPITAAQQAQRDQRRGNYARTQPQLRQVPATQRGLDAGGGRPGAQYSESTSSTGANWWDDLPPGWIRDATGGRPPAQGGGGLDTIGPLGTGGDVSTGGVTGGLADSDSYVTDAGSTTTTQPWQETGTIESIYRNQLGREPDAAGLQFYQGLLDQGVSIDEIRKRIMQDNEGQAYVSGTETNLGQAYQNALGREADPTGLQFYAAAIDRGEMTMQQAIDQMRGSDEGTVYRDTVNYGLDPALETVTEAEEKADTTNKENLEKAISELDPYTEAGQEAMRMYMDMFSDDPAIREAAHEKWRNTPGYQFAKEEGLSAIQGNAAATGGLGGGNVRKAFLEYGTGLADQTFQQYMENLKTPMGMGLSAATSKGNLYDAATTRAMQNAQWGGTQRSGMQWQTGRDIAENDRAISAQIAETQIAEMEAQEQVMTGGYDILSALAAGTLTNLSQAQLAQLQALLEVDKNAITLLNQLYTSSGSSTGATADPFNLNMDLSDWLIQQQPAEK